MKKVITPITFILSTIFLVSFFSIDACMDAGGSWSNFGFTCLGASADFIPQYKRSVPIFWVVVFMVSGIISFTINKVLANAKP